ncbi:MAG TPA: carboxymuconolactone decarboxylase family protein [Verrucomicrobiota bacterium]|nr:carboxymuconolactone decarboxylase family protein [Verrucomicrobiota bacterium]HQB17576.1 carboxymuconolactone decarboxylase family protein [Verrucomicrobiota bacterium]
MRLDYQKVAPGISQAMMGLENYVRTSGLEKSLLTLVKMRASQINGCAYCLDMHTKEARAIHESEQKLGSLAHWRTADCFTPRERAALAWTEALTLIAENHVPEELFNETRQHFSEKALADLSLAIISINGWNRLNISFRLDPESCPVE